MFEGFPELTARKSRTFSLDSDVLKEMNDVVIVPERIRIVSVIGRGKMLRVGFKFDILSTSLAWCVYVGNFGRVYKGILDGSRSVAVKAMLGETIN